ncbi:hypothetical protein F441_22258 [Phytophthora nicotianae CJ01A1]|uniref:PiggyBac transposable element-derived protein domain-containing protein n=2 Tax=Phytophthora nicotianae TaxID=4792 RepID=W2VRP5_PHYNI|nr:hypothetical protein L916_19272 [Phytophthora nicotianae]ETP00323.1 hypothetical protein F441_22258 [Phytophthora nicotianae CJ01A1]
MSDDEDENVLVSDSEDDASDYNYHNSSGDEDDVEPTLETTEDELRQLAVGGWKGYDADDSGDFLLSSTTDYYNVPSGPTRSAFGFADSPLGLFFYFLPKKLWIRIADESNRYRSQLIPELSQRRREASLMQQATDFL